MSIKKPLPSFAVVYILKLGRLTGYIGDLLLVGLLHKGKNHKSAFTNHI
jgi:hypothetical protein